MMMTAGSAALIVGLVLGFVSKVMQKKLRVCCSVRGLKGGRREGGEDKGGNARLEVSELLKDEERL